MRLSIVLTVAALALSGCVVQGPPPTAPVPVPQVQPPKPAPDAAVRSNARVVINREMAKRLPGANVAPYTDCVIQNASTAELANIADSAATLDDAMHRRCRSRGQDGRLMAGRGALMAFVPVFLGIAGCATAPVPVEEAEMTCLRDARDAVRPRTEIGLGLGSDGYRGGYVGVELSSDYIMGRSPADVFDACVRRRSGHAPNRPLNEQPGWSA
jgi:hypothetical protein